MLNIIRRAKETPAVRAREPEPARWMRDFFDWDPFREMAPAWTGTEPVFTPAFEVKENPEAFVFKADLPGIKEADVEVKLDGNRLTIAGKREAEVETKEETYYAFERTYGRFMRVFTLPEGIDPEHVKAVLEEGVLTVAIPKLPAAVAKKIEVKAGAKKQ